MRSPTIETHGEDHGRTRMDLAVANRNTIAPLPVSYTMVPPVGKTHDPIVAVKRGVLEAHSIINSDEIAKELYGDGHDCSTSPKYRPNPCSCRRPTAVCDRKKQNKNKYSGSVQKGSQGSSLYVRLDQDTFDSFFKHFNKARPPSLFDMCQLQ